jgi:crossover junction endodeoxyribonuclease RuvC
MRILGVDPGTRRCGYGVIDAQPGRLTYVECGTIEMDGKQPLAERLAELAGAMRELIDEFRPEAVAVEDIFHGVDARAALTLGHARGVILAAAGASKIPVWPYPPATVKKAVTGRGRAEKAQVGFMMRTLLALRAAPAVDAADALAVAVCHAHNAGGKA